MVKYESNSLTFYYEIDGQGKVERVYPCQCGEIHRGDYAIYDFGHHVCFHDSPLLLLDEKINQLLCGDCGKTFSIEGKDDGICN